MRKSLFNIIRTITLAFGLLSLVWSVKFLKEVLISGLASERSQWMWQWGRWALAVFLAGGFLSYLLRERTGAERLEASQNTTSKPDPKEDVSGQTLHEQLYYKAYEKSRNPKTMTKRESVTYNAYALYLYIEGDGLDGGIDNMGANEARQALWALSELGLNKLAKEIERFIDYFEQTEPKTQEDTSRHFRYCREIYGRIVSLGFDEIPRRLDDYLSG
ncbi:hypothetical protein R3X27_03125 [Tropicimonas sp. TH_r6]|uniref:hypothetical protein n=1 Tax=Tropicimonas sp. TH_r6 TaxID=3082085 RepID=UPI00295392C1|nr:hypothetical protein [Tropicimonas sp. TH_r6]MDV7141668.1 hypothetical protein [Tropicimonas sp. TH_r6]